MPVDAEVRRLGAGDLAAYKALRDDMLAAHPEAFTSDASTEAAKEPADYLHRFGLDRPGDGRFVLGAVRDDRLLGAIGCERDARVKVRHVGHLVGMMVRRDWRGRGLGRLLLDACIAEAGRTPGLEQLTLSVTADNDAAVALYRAAGFTVYGRLERAIRVDGRYFAKQLMSLPLAIVT